MVDNLLFVCFNVSSFRPVVHFPQEDFDLEAGLMLPGQILKTLLLKWEKCYWDNFTRTNDAWTNGTETDLLKKVPDT